MSETQPRLVSVIIPMHNAEQWIVECVTSVLRQTYGNLQIIVVDDGSTDNTCELLRRLLPPAALLIRQANRGVAAARNVGLSRATGEFVAFLDHDDVWEQDKIKLQLAYMELHPEVSVVFTDATEFTEGGQDQLSFVALHPQIALVESLIEPIVRCQVPLLSTVMVRRAFLVEHRINFDPEAAGVDDVGLFLEILGRNGRFACLDQSCVRRRMHSENQSRNHLRRFQRRIVLYRNLLSRCRDIDSGLVKWIKWGLSDAEFRVGEHYWGLERIDEARLHFRNALRSWTGNRKALLGMLYTFLPCPLARVLRKAKRLAP